MHKRNLVYLTPTDTTMGFVSQDANRLDEIKQRPRDKQYIKALPSLKTLGSFVRTPKIHKNRVRRANRTTFIFPDGNSYRLIKDSQHLRLIQKLGWAYTTSANQSGESYDQDFASSVADVIIKYPSKTKNASQIFKINSRQIKRVR